MPRKPTPPEQMRARLVTSKAAGIPFERAWAVAFSRVRWPATCEDRRLWKAILAEHEPHWRAAYEDRDAPSAALAMLSEDFRRGLLAA